MLTGEVTVDRLIPEGYEDLCGEGGQPVDWQVKSRQDRVGDFSMRDVCKHALKMSVDQGRRASTARPVLILERGIKGAPLPNAVTRLHELPIDHPLREVMDSLADAPKVDRLDVDRAIERVEILVVPNSTARSGAVNALAARYGVHRAVAEKLLLAIRDRIADLVDRNASAGVDDRAVLDRTAVERLIQESLNDIDPSALTEAVRTGACAPLDLDTPMDDDQYFLGMDAQPGHVAAGLPAPRHVLTGSIASALTSSACVLITGPSGVGKSTAMWSAAAYASHITWFRVMRLAEEDVEPIARLARALRPTAQTPVGFVVDGVGLGAAQAWDQLVGRLAGVAHVHLMGTARTEDLVALRSLSSTTALDVRLDEEVAEIIFAGLSQSGATLAPHWREAYENCHGLTLEFTHYLTQGRRLDDVLTSQVQRRILEHRDLELKVLALVSLAHSCGLPLAMQQVQELVAASDADFRIALTSLNDEHLVRESDGQLSGLHQLRSLALVEAVHANPPPLRAQTLSAVLGLVAPREVSQVLISALYRWSDLDRETLTAVRGMLQDSASNGISWTGVLLALRMVDFQRLATSWANSEVLKDLSPADRSLSVGMALASSDDPSDIFRPEIAAAIRTIQSSLTSASPLRDQMLTSLGADLVEEHLQAIGDVREAAAFLAVIEGSSLNLSKELRDNSNFASSLRVASVEDVSELLYLADQSSPSPGMNLARRIQNLLGGEDAVLAKLLAEEPTMLEVNRAPRADGDVAFARILHIHDDLDSDSQGTTKRIARLLLRCLPGTITADVETTIARDTPFEIGGQNFHVSHLVRRYALTSLDVDWNRTRSLIALDVLGTMTPTERATTATALLDEIERYACELLTSWVTHRRTGADVLELEATRERSRQLNASLTIPIERLDLINRTLPLAAQRMSQTNSGTDLGATVGGAAPGFPMDDVHTLAHSVLHVLSNHLQNDDFKLIAAHLSSIVTKTLPAIRENERWDLAGADGPPASLNRIAVTLEQMRIIAGAVGYGEMSLAETQKHARRVRRADALQAASDLAHRFKGNWLAGRLDRLAGDARARGVSLRALTQQLPDPDSYWPDVDQVILVDAADLDSWSEALPIVDELVIALRTHGHLPPTLIVPVIGGHTVSKLARRLIRSAWPAETETEVWLDRLPPLAATPALDAVTRATSALMVLSGTAYLATRRPLAPQLLQARAEAASAVTVELAALADLNPDTIYNEIVDELCRLRDAVEAEHPGDDGHSAEPAGTYAAGVGEAMGGRENALNDLLITMQGAALLWDVSRL